MMKKALIPLILLILIGSAGAQEIIDYTANVRAENTNLNEEVTLMIKNNHPTALRKITYPFSGQVQNLKTFDEQGGLESEVELRGSNNYVTTELRDPLGIDENATILYEFQDPSSVTFFNKTYFLSTSFPLLANVKRFELVLRLPEGTGLSDPEADVIPAPSQITSDGRAVILKWTANNPADFRVFVKYEILAPEPTTTTTTSSTTTTSPPSTPPPEESIVGDTLILGLSIVMLLIFSGLLAVKLGSRKSIEAKIDILKDDEQLILKIVAEEDGIGQREIQRKTDFSKTKVSKVLSELEKRGVIRKETIGKKNRIFLAEKLKE